MLPHPIPPHQGEESDGRLTTGETRLQGVGDGPLAHEDLMLTYSASAPQILFVMSAATV